MSDDPRIAVVGCGSWGSNHLRVWSELDALEIACDTDPGRVKELDRDRPELRTTTDPDEVFEDPRVDGVVVSTPAVTHYEMARRALEAGKDVLVEKPLAMTVDRGQALADLAAANDRILLVGHVLEYHPAVRRLVDLCDEGQLGAIRYLYSHRLSLGRIRNEENALWSFAPHDVALMLRLLDDKPTRVTAEGGAYLNHDVADVTVTNLKFPRNVQAHIFVSWLHPFKEQRFVVVGEDQMAVFNDTLPWDRKLRVYPHQVDIQDDRAPVAHEADAIPVDVEAMEPLRLECEDFLRSIRTREPPLSDVRNGVAVLEVLEAAQRALGNEPA